MKDNQLRKISATHRFGTTVSCICKPEDVEQAKQRVRDGIMKLDIQYAKVFNDAFQLTPDILNAPH